MKQLTVAITGASSGIGKALAFEYAAPNVTLFLSARNKDRLEDVAQECRAKGAQAHVQILEITDQQAVDQWVNEIEEKTPVDIALSSAGIMHTCDVGDPIEAIEKTIEQIHVNLCGSIYFSKAVARHMVKRGSGKIGLIGSMAALQPIADIQGYSASKAGLVAYGEALHARLAEEGVSVSTICPGYVATPMNSDLKSFRPFEISAKKAARCIKASINKGKAFDAFPLPLLLIIKLGRLAPMWLRRFTTRPFRFVQKPKR